MRSAIRVLGAVAFVLLVSAQSAYAWHIGGYVRCDANNNGLVDDGDLPLAGVTVTIKGVSVATFEASGATGADGKFAIGVLDFPASYTVTVAVPNGATVISPENPYTVVIPEAIVPPYVVTLVSSAACANSACWLTGGGAKFSNILGINVAEKGPQHSFGGNVNPGCSPTAGDGGSWNHVAHGLKLHFHGQAIRVIRCGNVPGIPEGSESPVTPFNFIEFEGVGTLTGVAGNKVDYGEVTFWARAEDRNEPGSSGAKDGALVDRYYLRVWDSLGVNRLLVDNGAGAPVPITDGNLQIHISSCAEQ
jgi:hypothetical protein